MGPTLSLQPCSRQLQQQARGVPGPGPTGSLSPGPVTVAPGLWAVPSLSLLLSRERRRPLLAAEWFFNSKSGPLALAAARHWAPSHFESSWHIWQFLLRLECNGPGPRPVRSRTRDT